jgi:hypothetical protein
MKKEFVFKENSSNIENLYHYANYKFPALKSRLEYDEWGQFVMYKKNEDTTIFYYVRAVTGDLNYNVYKKVKTDFVAKIDKPIIQDFKTKVYSEESLKNIFDKILKPLN